MGASIISRDGLPSELLESWLSKRAEPAWAREEADLETRVSRVIGAMPFAWLPVPDRGAGGSDRGWLERNTIAILSGLTGSADVPSPHWLGRWAPRAEVRESGLWNVNHVRDVYDPCAVSEIEAYADAGPSTAT